MKNNSHLYQPYALKLQGTLPGLPAVWQAVWLRGGHGLEADPSSIPLPPSTVALKKPPVFSEL